MRRRTKTILLIGLGIWILLSISFMGCILARFVWGVQLFNELAALKKNGRPTTYAELIRKKVPDDQNAAPLYLKAMRALSIKMTGDSETLSKYGENPEDWTRREEIIGRNAEAISLAEQAAQKPHCQFPNYGNLSGTLFPEYAATRNFTRLFALKALVDAKDGKTDEFIRKIGQCIKVEESLKEDPGMMPYLVRFADFAITSKAAKACLTNESINFDQAKTLFDLYGSIDFNQGIVTALDAERLHVLALIQRDRASIVYIPTYPDDFQFRFNPNNPETFLHTRIQKMKYRILSIAYMAVGVRGDALELIRSTNRLEEGVTKDFMAQVPLGQRHLPFYAVMTKCWSPSHIAAVRKYWTMICLQNGDRVLFAILAYKSRYGKYPNSLSRVESDLRWKLPRDPYNGEAFRYKPQKKGFLLYSVGPNMKDDGGVQRKPKYFDPREKADLIWKWER